jgi:hypothetical protein
MACKTKEKTNKFLNILKNFFKKKEERSVFIGKGFSLDDIKKEELVDIKLENSNRVNHMFIFGAPGVGKTRTLENIIEQDIPAGDSIVIIDPKGDIDLFSKVYQLALQTNRLDDLMFLTNIYPEYSIKINPLAHYYMIDEVIDHIMAGVPADDDFFYNVAKETTTAIVRGRILIRKITKRKTPLNFLEISKYCYYEGLKKLKSDVESVNTDDEELASEKRFITNLLEKILSSPQDYFSKVTSTLRTTLTIMTSGNIGKVIGNVKSNIFIDKLENDEPIILYVMTGSLLSRESAPILNKVALSMIQASIGRTYSSGKKYKNRLNIFIDEAASAVYKGIETIPAQGRGANVSVTFITQSPADMIAQIGKDSAKRLMDLTSTKLIMRLNEEESAKMISAYGGKVKNFSSILNINGGVMTREVEEYAVSPEDVLRLKKREFFYFGFEGEFKGKTARVNPTEVIIKMPNALATGEIR